METTPNDFRSNLGNIKENVKQGVKQELDKSGWTDTYNMAQDRAREAMDASEEFVKAHPFYTVLGAAAVGLVAGLLIRRR
ncbi:YqjD family protein [Bdellovibrio bacteriovorus]|uniref:DUF883 domain-containing protein n=1 Tax=Bdellovibrio bacteriovorus TaxID=959 RepID=A0A150WBK0_BDEBC|nr:DUF883 family protein [Bdellovibrio bacteriovorus]KYG60339.1 hypothetical protein AZI85_12755 [Bdellovibrio bacteriovorus]KYG64324.1 hypothetical protein AZI87_13915 [Bdellovibrio bacteriovorus]